MAKQTFGWPGAAQRVRDNAARTNDVLESFHAALRRCVKVSHPNLCSFLGHLQASADDDRPDERHAAHPERAADKTNQE